MPSDKPHRLDPMLNPASIAIVGAQAQAGVSGNNVLRTCLGGGYAGSVFLVNPNIKEIDGLACYPSLLDIPEKIDVAALVVGNNRIEQVFRDAVSAGVRAAVVYGSCLSETDADDATPLRERIIRMALDNGIEICGFNCAGFKNNDTATSLQLQPIGEWNRGETCLLSQSGSIYAALVHNGGRLDYNLSVSTGQEVVTDLTDYMDYALEMESTRTIGLFIETVRKPGAFIDALEKAANRDIAVVALKVARTERSKRFAMSHSGAIAGDDSGFDAVFKKYGVLRADDPAELMATLQLLGCGKRAGQGGLAAISDSGGERELLTDLAAETGVPLANINETTHEQIAAEVEYGVEAENPLDAWNTGKDFGRVFQNSMQALMNDPEAAIGIWVADMHDDLDHYWRYAEGASMIATKNDKPLAFATCYSTGDNDCLVRKLASSGIPVLEGMRPAMTAVRRLLDYRDFQTRWRSRHEPVSPAAQKTANQWRERLRETTPLPPIEAFALLEDFGVPVVRSICASNERGAILAASDISYPVALKTANGSISHKSDVGGVVLNITGESALCESYNRLRDAFGPEVLVSAMASEGCELAFGIVHDELFGPLAMVAAGGLFIEQFRDAVFAMPPFDSETARLLIDAIDIRPVLDGLRGAGPVDMALLSQAFSNFSHLVALFGDLLTELDINPIIAGPDNITAVDVLIRTSGDTLSRHE